MTDKDRSANETILGYIYQFDRTILEILKLKRDTDSICIEGIEDIDVKGANEETAIQCKYYAKTEYNHSLLGKPIRFMLSHFKALSDAKAALVNYHICGKYKSGQSKLAIPFDIDFLKTHFLSYKEKGVLHEHHRKLSLSDGELQNFISHLWIDINAKSYEEQHSEISSGLRSVFGCSEVEADYFYYNSALAEVQKIAIQPDKCNRIISKKDFLKTINQRQILFNLWFLQTKGRQAYFKEIKKAWFTLPFNVSPHERFFLVQMDAAKDSISNLKTLLLCIQKKWSKFSKRDAQSFCPYVYIHGIPQNKLVELKTTLRDEGYPIVDGHDFCDAGFSAKSIMRRTNCPNEIKFVNKLLCLDEILAATNPTKEVYQFYLNKPFYSVKSQKIRHLAIQIENLDEVMGVIK